VAARAANYTFMKDAVHAPRTGFYDYIIVGGGTAGCPLAATLSARARVLLLERGGSPYEDARVLNMAHFSDVLADTSASSPSQRFVSEDGVINSRPRVLGGGSCINAGFFTRAGAGYVRAAGWDPREVRAAYRWVEDVVAFRPALGPWQAAVRMGLLETGVLPDNGATYDHIPGTKVGGSIFDADGRRHTAADLLRYANPDGIDLYLRARVAKILFRFKGIIEMPNPVIFVKEQRASECNGIKERLQVNVTVVPVCGVFVGVTRFGGRRTDRRANISLQEPSRWRTALCTTTREATLTRRTSAPAPPARSSCRRGRWAARSS
jgi:choline dehydrogenase